jgi:GAF domain-containing protein
MNSLKAFLDRIFDVSAYPKVGDKDRVRLAYAMAVLELFVLTIPLIILLVPRLSGEIPEYTIFSNEGLFALIVLVVVSCVGTIAALRRGNKGALVIPVALVWVLIIPQDVIAGFTGDVTTFLVLIPLSGLLLGQTGIVVSFLMSVGVMTAYGLFGAGFVTSYRAFETFDWFRIFFLFVATSIISYLYLRLARSGEIGAQIASTESRYRLASITTGVSNRITRQMPLTDVLNGAVSLITESYPNVYHAQVFLTENATNTAQLVASTGAAGRQLLARHHSLPVGSQSVIGQVTALGEPVVTRAGEAVHRPNELLPQTAAEAAFPLRLGDVVIGALDLQSRQDDAFETEELPIFQALADTLAVVIDNARLNDQTEQRLLENQHLLEEARRSAREVERLNLELTRQAWANTIEANRQAYSLEVDFVQDTVTTVSPATATLTQAIVSDEMVDAPVTIDPERPNQGRVVAVPLRVRGQVVGAMEFEVDASGMLKPEDIALVQAMGERLGLALDNSRLYQESRRFAEREAVLNTVSSRLQASNHVDTLLAEAARGLQTTLGAQRVAIRLGAPASPQKRNGA